MKIKLLLSLLVFIGFFASPRSYAGLIIVESTFDNNNDGWRRSGDASSVYRWHASGGNPGGYISVQDAAHGAADYFVAPGKFLGNLENFWDGYFSFDIRPSTLTNRVAGALVVIQSGAGSLLSKLTASNITGVRAGQWNSLVFQLTPVEWLLGGRTPTDTEFLSVLSSVSQISILADWRSGAETVSLDNVRLVGNTVEVSEPSAAGIFSLGLLGLLLLFRRKSLAY